MTRAKAWLGAALTSAVLLTSLVMACASNSGTGADTRPVLAGATITGNYLAAQHARSAGDDRDAATFLLAALQDAPDDPVLLGRAYVVLAMDGRVPEAVDTARRLTEIENVLLANIVAAVGDLHDGRYDDAATRLGRAPSGPLATVLVPLLQAWTEFGRGDRAAAMAKLEPLRAIPGVGTLYSVHAAWIADAAGDEVDAVRHLQAAIEAQPEPWLRLAELGGGIFERAGQPQQAEALYRKYAERHPESDLLEPELARLRAGGAAKRDITSARDGTAEALFDVAGFIGRQNNRDTALVLGQLGLYMRPNLPPLQILVAELLDADDRYADANRLYASVDPSSPLAASAQIGVARNLDRMQRVEDARAMLLRLAAEQPADPEPLSELGDMLRRRDRFAEAVEAYDQAIARIQPLQPRHWHLLYARGIALERSKQWPRAEADFLQALQFEPEQPFVLNYLGYSWVEQGRNLDQAEAMIRKAVELRPEDGYIIDSLGWVLYRLGRPQEAVPQLERAVELKPQDPVINDHLGDAYWAAGREREARFQWSAALAGNPEPELKAVIEQKLQNGLVRAANAELP
jgi:tetratricopeptide (TPR) repeat protein